MKRAQTTSLRQLSWCFALVLSLLFSQYVGQRHRIDHTNWLPGGLAQLKAPPSSGSLNDATHSCIALDAATLADGLNSAIHFLLAENSPAVPLQAPACTAHQAPFLAWFQSRAPPVLS